MNAFKSRKESVQDFHVSIANLGIDSLKMLREVYRFDFFAHNGIIMEVIKLPEISPSSSQIHPMF